MDDKFVLAEFFPYRLNRASETVSLRFAHRYKTEFGLTRPEWRTIAALGSVGVMTAKDIGIHSTMHKTKVSRAVHALEQRRWLKRVEDDADRRFEQIELTPLGRKKHAELTVLARRYQDSLKNLLGKEAIVQLDAALRAIENAGELSMGEGG
ncbi:MAG: transcriptional regulator [Rhizobium sp.]|nr:transcriptional regulator [Rhizobium sp.]